MLNFRPLFNLQASAQAPSYLYRSGELIELSAEEVNFIAHDLKIKHYLDMRTVQEVDKNGKPEQLIDAGVTWINFPINDNNHYFRTKSNPDYNDYYDSYKELLVLNKEQYKNIIIHLAKVYKQGCIFSCFAGKDRTGILAILLMLFVGVERNDIITDYVASEKSLLNNINYFESKWTKKGLSKVQYAARLTPSPQTATLLIHHINSIYGGVSGYLDDIGLCHSDYQDMLLNLKLQLTKQQVNVL